MNNLVNRYDIYYGRLKEDHKIYINFKYNNNNTNTNNIFILFYFLKKEKLFGFVNVEADPKLRESIMQRWVGLNLVLGAHANSGGAFATPIRS